jgi:iron(III) transport system ATP-binding protein
MHEGALIEIGAPMELYTRPAHRVTADFLGSANFIPATVESGGDQPWDEMMVTSALGKFTARRSPEWQPGMAASLFFRPENVELLSDSEMSANEANHGSALVERATFLGNSADVMLRCGEIGLRVRAHPARVPRTGERVRFSVAPQSCIVFPA